MSNLGHLTDKQLMEYHTIYIKMKAASVRSENVKIQGLDSKFLYHVVRLLDEAEQILTLGDIDLQRNREQLKAIRRGDVSEEEIRKWASDKEAQLEKIYTESKLPYGPPEDKIKELLLQCLEEHYGNLDNCVVQPDKALVAISEIKEIVKNF